MARCTAIGLQLDGGRAVILWAPLPLNTGCQGLMIWGVDPAVIWNSGSRAKSLLLWPGFGVCEKAVQEKDPERISRKKSFAKAQLQR